MKKLFVLAVLVVGQIPLSAQVSDSSDLYVLSLEELMSIPITTASKFEQSIKEAPSTISLITRDQIMKYGWLSSNDLLTRLPSFSLSQDYDRKTVSSRGIFEGWNNNHLLMLIDGISFNDNMYGTAFTWEITPLVFAKSIEVIRGPGSALYGSSATNGLLSINTLSAEDLPGVGEVRMRFNNKGTRVFDLITGGKSEQVSFVSAINIYGTEGSNYTSLDAAATTPAYIDNKRSNFYLFNKIEGRGSLNGFSFQHHEQRWNFTTGHGWLFAVPDKPENMQESRRMMVLKYKTPDTDSKLSQEYVLRYQRHEVDWNTRLIPDGDPIYGGYYTYGLTELLKTATADVFLRAQLSYTLGENSVLLGGVERSVLIYDGDELHQSNANLNTDFSPTTNNELVNVGQYFAILGDHPFVNTGVFLQYNSPKVADLVTFTLGGRYDKSAFVYNDLVAGTESPKSFDKISPRLSIVFTPNKDLSIKLMGGQAFRTPAVSELFGSNTFLLASNIGELKPETITTAELATDWNLSPFLVWRFNAFYTVFEDQIAYSVSNANLSTNLFSLTTIGIENELTFQSGNLDGFVNHSFADRMDEEIVDPTIAISADTLTWVPQHLVNVGLRYSERLFNASLQAHYQGKVWRRSSDRSPALDAERGDVVDAWVTFDARVVFRPTTKLEIGLVGTNLLDKKGMLLKNNAYAFDYRISGRSILLDIRLQF